MIEFLLALISEKSFFNAYFSQIWSIFPIIEACFSSKNSSYLLDILWIIKQFTENNETFDRVIAMQNFDYILSCLKKEKKIATLSFRILNNLLTGTNEQIQCLLNKNILSIFLELLESPSVNIRKAVCFGISNICSADSAQIDQLFEHEIMNEIMKLAFIDDVLVIF